MTSLSFADKSEILMILNVSLIFCNRESRLKEILGRSFSCWLVHSLSYKGRMRHFRTQKKPLKLHWREPFARANEYM